MRRSLIFIVVILTAVITNPVYAQNTAITNGLNYLTSTQNPDGSWGDGATVTEILPATVSVMETLQVLERRSLSA
jgi:squalene cyclase